MPDSDDNLHLEIGHVLFIDIVGYSRLLIEEQKERLNQLTEIVLATAPVREATDEQLVRLPTGDGMALVFHHSPEEPARCAIEIAEALRKHPELPVRMGIHSGPVSEVKDVSGRSNIAGAGINMAQRVMDCGDAGHILLSQHVADDLVQYRQWAPRLHDLGDCEVKHGVRLHLVNLYADEAGNPEVPAKFVRTATSIEATEVSSAGRSKVVLMASVLALAVTIGFWMLRTRQMPRDSITSPSSLAVTPASLIEKSIAVLPLENLSADKENAFFAEGIQDDVLNSLAKIKELKVISRSSVMGYRNTATRNLREIGQQLGVANILEGSVRRAGNRVLVNVNLIDARNDRQIWAERYDRTLADSLTLQGELATEIAAALRVTLSPDEKARVEAKPTDNAEAYLLYLRAREYQTRPSTLLQDDETAVHLYTQALGLDPNFAVAHARLSATLAHIYAGYQPTAAIKTRARAEAEESLRLHPDLGEGRLARALCFYWTEMDYESALRELEVAGRLLPNDPEVEGFSAGIRRRQGRWSDALAGLERALTRDPRNARFARDLMATEHMLRKWSAAARASERAVALSPDRPAVLIEKSYIDFWARGDLGPLRSALATIPSSVDPENEVTWARWDVALLERDFAAAERAVADSASETMFTPYGIRVAKGYLLGCIAMANGESARAQPFFETACSGLEGAVLAFPTDPFRHAQLGLLYAYLGRKEDALREGRRAVELRPQSADAYQGPTFSALLAMIYAQTGEPDQALGLIEKLLTIPGPWVFEGSITLSDLRLRWQWDPLRAHPRFQKIVDGPEPKTVYE